MEDDKISVIIPVYNVKKYLSSCIESVLNQSYKNIEVILVDDGSTDGSNNICDKYAQKDDRIIVIHQKNMGVSAARNVGIMNVTGRYVTFVDSDDRLLLDAFEVALKYLIDASADVVTYGWKRVSIDGEISEIKEEYEIFDDNEKIIRRILEHYSACGGGYPWNKIWKTDVFQKKFPLFSLELFYFEDLEWVINMMLCINKLVVCPYCLYLYTIREDSATNNDNINEEREISYHKALQNIIDSLSVYPELKKWFRKKYYLELVNGVIGAKQRNYCKLATYLMKYVRIEKFHIIISKGVGINLKCRLLYILLLTKKI